MFALLGLGASCALAYLASQHLFNLNYFSWYIKSGPLITLAVAALGMVFGGFDEDPGFISRHPLEYVGSYCQAAGIVIFSMGSTVRSSARQASFIDLLLSMPLAIILTLSIIAWLLLIVPFQYFLFLICGALSRRSLLQTATTEFHQTSAIQKTEASQYNVKSFDKFWLDNGLRKKPFTLASAFSAILLQTISWLIGLT